MEGTVKFWNKKGFGFIESEELKEDIYVHYSSIVSEESFKKLNQGQKVNFKILQQQDGRVKASDVTMESIT